MSQFSILFNRPVDNTSIWFRIIKWIVVISVMLTPGTLLGAWIYHLIQG